MSLNGDHTSRFSVMNGKLDEPNKQKRGIGRKSRIGGKQKVEANRKRGGSHWSKLADEVEKKIGKPIKVEENKKWYLYDSDRGVWNRAGESESYLAKAWDVQAHDDVNPRTARLIVDSVVARNHINSEERFCGCIRSDPLDEGCYLINCPSGVLKIDFVSGRVIEKIGHSPNYLFTSCLAVDYNSKAECPRFLEVASEILPDERDRELLMLFFSYCLFPSCRLETALFCIGSGGNGKSLITNAIASVFGRENRISITLKEICKKDRKQLIRLDKKLVNISTEVEVDPIKDSATFKQLVSGEEVETDRLYRGGITISPVCKYCLLTNHMPEFGKGSNAEVRRIKIVHFPNEYDGDARNPNLLAELAVEKEGILKLLVDRLRIVTVINSFPLGGYESKAAQANFTVSNNPMAAFVKKHLEITNNRNDLLAREEVHRLYCDFQKANNLEYLNDVHMLRQLYEFCPKVKEESNIMRTIGDKRCRIVRYVKIKTAHVSTGKNT